VAKMKTFGISGAKFEKGVKWDIRGYG